MITMSYSSAEVLLVGDGKAFFAFGMGLLSLKTDERDWIYPSHDDHNSDEDAVPPAVALYLLKQDRDIGKTDQIGTDIGTKQLEEPTETLHYSGPTRSMPYASSTSDRVTTPSNLRRSAR